MKMGNIIKSIRYQTLRDNVTYLALLAGIVVLLVSVFDAKDLLSLTGSEYFINISAYPIAAAVIIIILATRICGCDFSDKTINYEVLAGHSRQNIYWGRVFSSFAFCLPAAVILLTLPPILLSIKNGWGIYMDFGGFILRCAVALLPLIRLLCECIMLAFLTKSAYLGLIASFLFSECGSVAFMFIDEYGRGKYDILKALHSFTNFSNLLTFSDYEYKYINGEDITFFETALNSSYLAATIICSIAGCALCLALGYLFVRKSDFK